MDLKTNDDESDLLNINPYNDSDENDSTPDSIDFANLPLVEKQAHEKIINLLLETSKIDFSHYRKSTVQRRLLRRLSLCKKNSFSEYLSFLESNPDEIHLLYNDLLLAYTSFFRDPHVFQLLKTNVFPSIVANRLVKDTIRIWVPGCSTGEEVYSLAICFQEFLETTNSKVNLKAQFFGTDLNPQNIQYARSAVYPDKIRQHLSKDQIEQYFDQTAQGLKVTKHIREMCIFAVQNIVQDPPFSNIDMVSCRNVLIYFDLSLQDIAIPLFHFSLRNQGFLLLGSSETMGRFPELFSLADQKINLYTKRASQSKSIYRIPVNRYRLKGKEEELKSQQTKPNIIDIKDQINDILLESFCPPAILVDSTLTIRHFRGRVYPYLEPLTGDASLKLSKMAHESLMPELYVVIEEVKKQLGTVTKSGITFKQDDTISLIDITVTPVHDYSQNELNFLIVFEKSSQPTYQNYSSEYVSEINEEENKRLRDELQITKEHLQSIIEDKDEVNQELWASNEEVQSTNEELQSVNEEMEAAKEELESSNEELISLNEELRIKNKELNDAIYLYNNIVETARALIVTLSADGTILSVNLHTEWLTGYSRGELIGKNWFDIFIPKISVDKINSIFQNILNQNTSNFKYENAITLKNGTEKIITWRNSALQDLNNVTNSILCIGIDVTDQRNTQYALSKSEEKYRNLVETSQDLIWQCDPDGKYTYLNPAWENILGYKLDEILGKEINFFEGQLNQSEQNTIINIIKNGIAVRGVESVCFDKSGNELNLIFNAVPNYSEDGQLEGISGTAHNITEWKRAEHRYQTLFDKMLDGFALHEMIFDHRGTPVDYRFLAVNPAFENLTGLKADDLIGFKVSEILPNIEQNWIKTYGNVVLTGEPVFFEDYSVDLEKHYTISAFRPSPGKFACIFTDITDRKNMEEKLQENLYRFDQLTEQTRTFLWETGPTGIFTFVSPVIEKILGYKPQELVGYKFFYELFPETNRETIRESVLEVIKSRQKLIDFQNELVTKDNRLLWFSTHGAPVYNKNNEFLGYRGGNTDITDRKKSEEIHSRLEQQQQQNHRLESLGILAGGIAHDFNNLLGGIFGYIDLAMETSSNPNTSQYLETAIKTIERARALTTQLLTFSKGGSPVQTTGYLFPFLKESIQFILSGSNVSCSFNIEPCLKPCDFDKNQIGQVFDNITINAMQAMPTGGTIILSAKNTTIAQNYNQSLAPGEYVLISVKDSGVGIPKEHLNLIFDPFFTTKSKGHGLGLSTCYSIIKKHNGCIEVESTPGQGSTFHIFIPVSNKQVPSKNDEQKMKHAGKGLFIIMDDEEVIRDTLEITLTSCGYTVVCKDNGEDAIDYFKNAIISGIKVSGMFFDLTIPGGMGGKEAIVEIRKLDSSIPVFVASGYADDPVLSKPEMFGFTGSIRKPFIQSDITRMLNKFMNNS